MKLQPRKPHAQHRRRSCSFLLIVAQSVVFGAPEKPYRLKIAHSRTPSLSGTARKNIQRCLPAGTGKVYLWSMAAAFRLMG